ncbi:MAG: UDP-N-acetylmuramate--L-alanine ligase, partial [Ginsengibacter sp.]
EVLDMADEVLLLPIYPARELPMEGVTSQIILDKMKNKNARIMSAEELLNYIAGSYKTSAQRSVFGELLITAGAGDIDRLVEPIKNFLTEV